MSMVTTLAELDALPIGAAVIDTDGDTWTRGADGWIHRDPDGYVSAVRYLTGEVFAYAPFRMPDEEPKPDVWAEAFERLHNRITRDLNFEASESAAPEDERWARTLDDLRQFADDLWDEAEAAAGAA